MGRNTKLPEERRSEIIQTAKELFIEKGFESTQISDITNKMGVAHGLVYHYFKSKSNLFDAVVEEWANEILTELISAMRDTSHSALERLERMFTYERNLEKDPSFLSFLKIANSPSYKDSHERIRSILIKIILPELKELIRQGNNDGSFNCNYPEDAAKFCLYGSNNIEQGVSTAEATRSEKVKYFYWRILGIK